MLITAIINFSILGGIDQLMIERVGVPIIYDLIEVNYQ